MTVQYSGKAAKLLQLRGHDRGTRRTDAEASLGDVLEIQGAAHAREVLCVAAESARDLDLAFVVRPQLGVHVFGELADHRIRFPSDPLASRQRLSE
jgi:hypothetical protein